MAGRVGRGSQDARLAHSGLAAHQERGALVLDAADHPIEERELGTPTDQAVSDR